MIYMNTMMKALKKLHMFQSCNVRHTMEELVQDLGNALDESCKQKGTDINHLGRPTKKRRGWKRRSESMRSQYGNLSEASQSSLDEALKDYMENVTQNQSDSDDLTLTKRLSSMSFPNTNAIVLAESDSFNETFSPLHPHRRRRKFKRMAVDLPSMNEMCLTDCHTLTRKQKRLRKTDTVRCSQDAPGALVCKDLTLESHPGKRKRSIKDKSGSSFDNDFIQQDQENFDCAGAVASVMDGVDMYNQDSASSVSSGESDIGFYTNDEGRDADDEQSDYFHEAGPACGIPSIVPWWDMERPYDEEMEKDPTFHQILTGSFEHMSPSSQRSFKARLDLLMQGRAIRTGRRRLDVKDPRYTMASFMKDRQQWDNPSHSQKKTPPNWHSCSNGVNDSGETKRPRRTPPPSPDIEGFVGANADPIPDSNLGSQLLQSMGWIPGNGLGSDGQGILNPVMALLRPKRRGFGAPTKS